jgi:hypothetical protein
MKLTENIDAHISAYEQETGEVLKPQVVALIKELAAASDFFENLGKKEARSDLTLLTKEAFIKWGRQNLNATEGVKETIADMMYQCYLGGYNAGKEAQHV